MLRLQFLPMLKHWVSLEGFYDDYAHPGNDEHFCHACSSRQYNEWLKEPCKLCGKPMGDEPEGYYYNCDSDSAHKACAEKLSPEDLDADEWTDEYY